MDKAEFMDIQESLPNAMRTISDVYRDLEGEDFQEEGDDNL